MLDILLWPKLLRNKSAVMINYASAIKPKATSRGLSDELCRRFMDFQSVVTVPPLGTVAVAATRDKFISLDVMDSQKVNKEAQ